VIVLTVLFAMLNICLGFALAVFIKSGPDGFNEIWQLIASRFTPNKVIQLQATSIIPATEAIQEPLPCAQPEQTAPIVEESPKDDSSELVEEELPENWDIDEKFVETSILRLNFAIMKSNTKAVQIDTKLRECQGHSSGETIEACTRLLLDDCKSYLAEQTEAAERIQSRMSEFGNLKKLCEEIDMTNLEQSAQVETTINNLQYMDFHSDPEAANLRLIEELKNLYMARFKLRDNQESVFLTIARNEKRLDKIDKRLFPDPLTKLNNRIGLESKLFDWWRQGLHQNRRMIAAAFDINGFSALNQKFGLMAGDRILCQLARFMQSSIGEEDMVGRLSGQQFLVMMMDVGSNVALKLVELWQQTIEKMAFQYRGRPIRTTVSAAVGLVDPADAHYKVFERQENLIKQVKLIGPNRIIFHNGTNASPLEQHKLGLQDTEIVL
jgi:diguanylate cyclase (GGDEF)-like protein